MNRLLTPIPYETVLGDLRDSGGLNLSDQVARQVILPIGNASPDGDDSSVTSRLIKSDSGGSLLTPRSSIGYSELSESTLNYTADPVQHPVIWPAGYKELWMCWCEQNFTSVLFILTGEGVFYHEVVFDVWTKLPGIQSDFIVFPIGEAGRTGTVDFSFLK